MGWRASAFRRSFNTFFEKKCHPRLRAHGRWGPDVFDAVGEKPSGQYLGLICDESLTCHGLNLNLGYFSCFTFIFISCGESRLLVSWCAGGRCGMTDSDEDSGRSKRPDVEDQG
jgi:hypothetical protein